MLPTIPQIVTAARATSNTSPRPTRAFWLAACRLILNEMISVAQHLCTAHNWRSDRNYRATALTHLEAMGEADLRAAFVELTLYAATDEDAARQIWSEALDLRDDDGNAP